MTDPKAVPQPATDSERGADTNLMGERPLTDFPGGVIPHHVAVERYAAKKAPPPPPASEIPTLADVVVETTTLEGDST